jgi:microcystin-dependent protein
VTPFIGEIKIVSFNFPPKNWAFCNGQLLPINQNQALFSILGTTYGGDGRVNFALPDLQGRMPVYAGNGIILGQKGGEQSVTLDITQIPAHAHSLFATSTLAGFANPAGHLVAAKPRGGKDIYAPPGNVVTLNSGALGPTGGSQPHNNMQPYLTLNFVIALQGIFPSRN